MCDFKHVKLAFDGGWRELNSMTHTLIFIAFMLLCIVVELAILIGVIARDA